MSYSSNVWDQIKGLTCEEIIKALEKDGWVRETRAGAELLFIKPPKRVTIHYHPHRSKPPGVLKAILQTIGWTEDDMRRLKLVK